MPILPGGVQAALAYYLERLGTPDKVSMAYAAELHDVSRQAVQQARDAQGRSGRPGRKPRAGVPSQSYRIRATAGEWASWTEAAGEQPTAAWVRDQANAAAGRKERGR